MLVGHGPQLFAEDRSVLERFAAAAALAWEGQHLAARADRLVEVDRVRSALLAAVGHDLRTPLSGLKAAVSSLRQDDVTWSPAEEAELLATIEESSDRLADLIANLLDMTRLQVGAGTAHPVPVALDEVVSRALLDVPSDTLRMTIADALPLVSAGPGLLERVVANLVDNARRHTPDGRAVRLEAALTAGRVELRVIDSGPGVPAGVVDQVGHHAFEEPGVRRHQWKVVGDGHPEGLGWHVEQGSRHDLVEGDRHRMRGDRPDLQPGHVQQVGDQVGQPVG